MKIKQLLAVSIGAFLLFGSSVFMTGCGAVESITGNNPITSALSTSKKTSQDDYDKYVEIQDPNGTQYISVIRLQQKNTPEIDVDLIKKVLADANINWYQIIASSSLGTNQQQYAYLYLSSNAIYNDAVNAVTILNTNFDAFICTPEEYKNYIGNKNPGSVINTDLYHSEMTYYGPAAKK